MKKFILIFTLLLNLILNVIKTESIQPNIEEIMREKMNLLGQGNSFSYIDLGLNK